MYTRKIMPDAIKKNNKKFASKRFKKCGDVIAGIFFPQMKSTPSNPRNNDQPTDVFDLSCVHDWDLRNRLVLWIHSLCLDMVFCNVPKKTIAIVNVYSDQHEEYIRAVTDLDLRKIAALFGIRIVMTTRGGMYWGDTNNLYMHLTKHNRIASRQKRDGKVKEIVERSHNMYI